MSEGFVNVFPGWNVWSVWQADDPDRSVLEALWMAGVSPERALRIWVEDQVDDNAPGAIVGDPVSPNPKKLKGDMVQVLPNANGLAPVQMRGDVPGLAGSQQLGEQGSGAQQHFVRFFNRGAGAAMPWPHDANFLVENVYQPSAQNPITNAPDPGSFGGDLTAAGKQLGHAIEVLAWVGGGVALLVLLSKMKGRS